jgi:hypothetical protein
MTGRKPAALSAATAVQRRMRLVGVIGHAAAQLGARGQETGDVGN